ncbi:MAG TPA: ABC transporter permease subunit/CPBP intramembrane protease [Planctomycetota bacterium]|nr:ABC transporter permease subunit/CPBP intramembrane protease [Planctomycetota bacterium]
MRRSALRLIASKEILDTLRDRRTLFVSLILPLLLYPTLLLGLTQIIGTTQKNLNLEHQRIVLVGEVPEAVLNHLRAEKLDPVAADTEEKGLSKRLIDALAEVEEGEVPEAGRARLRELLTGRKLAGALVLREGFAGLLRLEKRAAAVLLFDPTDDQSKVARAKTVAAMRKFEVLCRDDLLRRYPQDEERLRFAEAPVAESEVEVASSSQKGAHSFAPLLGMLIVIMALTGAFYPAVDLAAGEKERGTLETLLVAPVTRTEIVLGKFAAVWVIAVVTALLNLVVMGLTFSKVAGMIGGGKIAFSLSLGAAATVCAILIPTAALFSAVALALSSFATSYKEGQHYMSPLFLVATPLAMVGLLPNVEIGYTLAVVPVANIVLLVKAMLLGSEAAGPALVAFGAMVFYAAVALGFAVAVFRRESVLFRTGSGRGFDPASLLAARQGLPRAGQGFLLFFVVIAVMFFLSSPVTTVGQAVGAFLKAQFVAVLLPTFVLARALKLDLRATFALRRPRWGALPPVLVGALATLLLVIAFQSYVMPKPTEAGAFEELMKRVTELPRWQLYLLVAFLPPVCEELLCRGFLLSSFRARFGDLQAILLSAVLFGALHLDLQRIPATAIAGIALGYVRLRTGTIVAPVLFHMIYNGTLFDLATDGYLQEIASWFGVPTNEMHLLLEKPPLAAVAAAAAAFAGAAVWLRLVEPRSEVAAPDAAAAAARPDDAV